MDTVNENSSSVLRINFFDENREAATPNAITYRIDDVSSSTAIKATTALSPDGTSIDIDITATQNAILTSSNAFEIRAVTGTFTYASGAKQGVFEILYQVKNLNFVS